MASIEIEGHRISLERAHRKYVGELSWVAYDKTWVIHNGDPFEFGQYHRHYQAWRWVGVRICRDAADTVKTMNDYGEVSDTYYLFIQKFGDLTYYVPDDHIA